MLILQRNIFIRLWVLVSILWMTFVIWVAYREVHGLKERDVVVLIAIAFVPSIIVFVTGWGLSWIWGHFAKAHWLSLPTYMRRGFLRLYLVVSVPWIAWYGYQIYDSAQRSRYISHAREIEIFHAFWSLLIVPIGSPILLLAVVWILAGFQKSVSMTDEARTAQKRSDRSPPSQTDPKQSPIRQPNTPSREPPAPPKSEPKTSAKHLPDFFEIGRTMAVALMKPDDCWRDVCKLREYKAPDPVATCEMAFARAAVIKDAIRRGETNSNAAAMLAGVDKLVTEGFASEDTDETLKYYESKRLSAVGPQAVKYYEDNVFPLTQLADAFARRLSIGGFPNVEIAPLFDEVAAEAGRLMKVSTAIRKLNL